MPEPYWPKKRGAYTLKDAMQYHELARIRCRYCKAVRYYSLKDPDFASVSDADDGLFVAYAFSALLVALPFVASLIIGFALWIVCATDILWMDE